LRTWDSRTQICSIANKKLAKAFAELHSLKDQLGLTNAVVEKSAYIPS